jgi:uncharacterized membrane protein
MSRRVVIKSPAVLSEQDLAEEVVAELRRQGARNLMYDAQERKFANEQYDDVCDETLQKAERLYGLKVNQRREEQLRHQQQLAETLIENLKKNGYKDQKIEKQPDGKIKIVAKQYVYA